MTLESHHEAALIETAKLALERAHRGARTTEAGELRRGMQIALDALEEAAALAENAARTPTAEALTRIAGNVERALADLDEGKLVELGALVEAARKDLGAASP